MELSSTSWVQVIFGTEEQCTTDEKLAIACYNTVQRLLLERIETTICCSPMSEDPIQTPVCMVYMHMLLPLHIWFLLKLVSGYHVWIPLSTLVTCSFAGFASSMMISERKTAWFVGWQFACTTEWPTRTSCQLFHFHKGYDNNSNIKPFIGKESVAWHIFMNLVDQHRIWLHVYVLFYSPTLQVGEKFCRKGEECATHIICGAKWFDTVLLPEFHAYK